MSPSSDIETLFGHFGGNAGDYQEIGRENEASSARTRWPLLVTLDLTQPSIPAVPQRHEHAAADGAAQAQSPEGGGEAAAAAAEAARSGTPQVRSKTPLFTRPHRRSIPPVEKAAKVEAPRGAERFSAIPPVVAPELAASETLAAASGVSAASVPAPATPPVSQAAPVAAYAAAPIPPVASVPPAHVAAPAPAPVAAYASVPPVAAPAAPAAPAYRSPGQSLAPAFAAPAAQPAPSPFATRAAVPAPAAFTPRAMAPIVSASPVARVAPAAQPQSILGKLFQPAAPGTVSSARTSAPEPAALGSVFDRLRGDTSNAATPASHSWLNKGPRRS